MGAEPRVFRHVIEIRNCVCGFYIIKTKVTKMQPVMEKHEDENINKMLAMYKCYRTPPLER